MLPVREDNTLINLMPRFKVRVKKSDGMDAECDNSPRRMTRSASRVASEYTGPSEKPLKKKRVVRNPLAQNAKKVQKNKKDVPAEGGAEGSIKKKSVKRKTQQTEANASKRQKVKANEITDKQSTKQASFRKRGAPKMLIEINNSLDDYQKDLIRNVGFGGLLDIKFPFIPEKLSAWLVGIFNIERSELVVPSRGSIKVDEAAVQRVLGLPNGQQPIEYKKLSHTDAFKDFYKDFGHSDDLKAPTFVEVENYFLGEGKGQTSNVWLKKWLLFAISSVLCPTTSSRLSVRGCHAIADTTTITNFNWCRLLLEQLVKGVVDYTKGIKSSVSGCLLFLVILYLDSLEVDIEIDQVPENRISVWTKSLIDKVIEMDKTSSTTFGKLKLKPHAIFGDSHLLIEPAKIQEFVNSSIPANCSLQTRDTIMAAISSLSYGINQTATNMVQQLLASGNVAEEDQIPAQNLEGQVHVDPPVHEQQEAEPRHRSSQTSKKHKKKQQKKKFVEEIGEESDIGDEETDEDDDLQELEKEDGSTKDPEYLVESRSKRKHDSVQHIPEAEDYGDSGDEEDTDEDEEEDEHEDGHDDDDDSDGKGDDDDDGNNGEGDNSTNAVDSQETANTIISETIRDIGQRTESEEAPPENIDAQDGKTDKHVDGNDGKGADDVECNNGGIGSSTNVVDSQDVHDDFDEDGKSDKHVDGNDGKGADDVEGNNGGIGSSTNVVDSQDVHDDLDEDGKSDKNVGSGNKKDKDVTVEVEDDHGSQQDSVESIDGTQTSASQSSGGFGNLSSFSSLKKLVEFPFGSNQPSQQLASTMHMFEVKEMDFMPVFGPEISSFSSAREMPLPDIPIGLPNELMQECQKLEEKVYQVDKIDFPAKKNKDKPSRIKIAAKRTDKMTRKQLAHKIVAGQVPIDVSPEPKCCPKNVENEKVAAPMHGVVYARKKLKGTISDKVVEPDPTLAATVLEEKIIAPATSEEKTRNVSDVNKSADDSVVLSEPKNKSVPSVEHREEFGILLPAIGDDFKTPPVQASEEDSWGTKEGSKKNLQLLSLLVIQKLQISPGAMRDDKLQAMRDAPSPPSFSLNLDSPQSQPKSQNSEDTWTSSLVDEIVRTQDEVSRIVEHAELSTVPVQNVKMSTQVPAGKDADNSHCYLRGADHEDEDQYPHIDFNTKGLFQASPIAKRIYSALRKSIVGNRKDDESTDNSPVIFKHGKFEATMKDIAAGLCPRRMVQTTTMHIGSYILSIDPSQERKLFLDAWATIKMMTTDYLAPMVTKYFNVSHTTYDYMMLPVFEDSKTKEAVGHWFLVVLNLKKRKFQVIDSLRKASHPDLRRMANLVKGRVCTLWNKYTAKASPCSIKHVHTFEIEYIEGFSQSTNIDCGVFTLKGMECWGEMEILPKIRELDIQDVRMSIVERWIHNPHNEADWGEACSQYEFKSRSKRN
ncbi:hypothetical protein ACP70R_027272 [Stipagrostis hirtigluma subsp. patula]